MGKCDVGLNLEEGVYTFLNGREENELSEEEHEKLGKLVDEWNEHVINCPECAPKGIPAS